MADNKNVNIAVTYLLSILKTSEAICLVICERVMIELDTSCERDGHEPFLYS
jgi:hypothetical protein